MEQIYGNRNQNNTSEAQNIQYAQQQLQQFSKDCLSKWKEFYLRFFPRLIKSFQRSEFLSCLLLFMLQMQEIALTFGHRQYLVPTSTNSNYYSQIVNGINYSLLVNIVKLATTRITAVESIFYACFAINLAILTFVLSLFFVYACYAFDARKIRKPAMVFSAIISTYTYILFLPSINVSMILYFDPEFGTSAQSILAAVNFAITWLIGTLIHMHDFEYSFKDVDKLSKRFSSLEFWKMIVSGLIPVVFQISSEAILCVYSAVFAISKQLIYYHDQTYYCPTVSIFYSMLNVFHCSAAIIFFIFQASDESRLDFTLLLLVAIPLSAKFGLAIYNYQTRSLFFKCLGKPNMNFLSPKELDIFLRTLSQNTSFFYEDYIDKEQGVIFENLYVSHQINCETTDYRCFCHDFRRTDNKLEFEEYIGQDFRKKYVMFYIVNLYESYLSACSKDIEKYNSVMFAYISFLFEIMKISTKSFNIINIFSIRLSESSSGLIDLFYEQVLHYRTKQEFQHFFSNPTYQNQRLQILAPIQFDENLVETRALLKQQLLHTGIFYDYLCSNYIDLVIVQKTAVILFKNLQKLREKLTLAYDLNPDNQNITLLAQYYSTFLEFENTKPATFKKNSLNLSKRMLLSQDRNIKVFSKHACVVYASLIKKDGLIKKVSDSFAKVYGIENQFILGKTLNSLIPKGLYNAHDDIISNFKNKGSMNIINKETRMVFGLNGEGFIIPLMIRLKLENMHDDFGVCALLTGVNHEKEYLFISDDGMIMDITKRLYNRIFKSISSINDLRRFDIKTLIPLIWGIQQVNEYDKTFYSVMAVSRQRIQRNRFERSEYDGLNDHTQMQQLVDSISVEDEIFSIQFRVCIITTSIGKNFKYVEFETIKLEDNLAKKRLHIQNLKMCLNDILKNDLVVLFKDFSDNQTRIPQQLNQQQQQQLLDQSKFFDTALEYSKVIEPDSSFEKFGRGSNPHKLGSSHKLSSSQNLKETTNEDSVLVATHPNGSNVNTGNPTNSYNNNNNNHPHRMFKNNLNNHIKTNFHDDHNTIPATAIREETGYYSHVDFLNSESNQVLQTQTQEQKFQNLLNQNKQSRMNAAAAAAAAAAASQAAPPSTDRQRLLDQNLPTETGQLSTRREYTNNTQAAGAASPRVGFDSSTNLQSPRGVQSPILGQHFFPSSGMGSPLAQAPPHFPHLHHKNNPKNYPQPHTQHNTHNVHHHHHHNNNNNPSDDRSYGAESASSSEHHSVDFIPEPKYLQTQQQRGHPILPRPSSKQHLSQESPTSPPGYFDSLNDKAFPSHDYAVQQSKYEFIEEEEEDEENYDDIGQVNQNEAITSYRALMKTNQHMRAAKTRHLSLLIQQQNTVRSLQSYNQEMKLSVDKNIVSRKEGDHSVPEPLSYQQIGVPSIPLAHAGAAPAATAATAGMITSLAANINNNLPGNLQTSLQIGSNSPRALTNAGAGDPGSLAPSKQTIPASAEQIQQKLMQQSSTESSKRKKNFGGSSNSLEDEDFDEYDDDGDDGDGNAEDCSIDKYNNNYAAGKNHNNRSEGNQPSKKESASINSSSMRSEESRRKLFIRRIRSSHISRGLQLMIYIGAFSFVVFMAISWTFYSESNSSYDSYIQDFQKINQSSLMYIDVLSVAKIYSYLSLTDSESYYAEDALLSQKRLKLYVDQYRQFLLNFISDSDAQDYYNFMITQPIDLVYFHEETELQKQYTRRETQFIAMIRFFFIIQQMKDTMNTSDYNFVWFNINEYHKNMMEMQSIIENQASTQFDSIRSIQIIMLLVILAITSILIFTIIPLSIYNTIKSEEILRLFGCFQPDKIQRVVDLIEISANRLNNQDILKAQNSLYFLDRTRKQSLKTRFKPAFNNSNTNLSLKQQQQPPQQNLVQQPLSESNIPDLALQKQPFSKPQQPLANSPSKPVSPQNDLQVKKIQSNQPAAAAAATTAIEKQKKPSINTTRSKNQKDQQKHHQNVQSSLGTTLKTKKLAQSLANTTRKHTKATTTISHSKHPMTQTAKHKSSVKPHSQQQQSQHHFERQSTNEISNGNGGHHQNLATHHGSPTSLQQQPKITSHSNLAKSHRKLNATTLLNLSSQKLTIKRLPQKRTRQIASFNTLPRIDFLIIGIALVVLAIVMVPPVLNIVFSNQYMTEGRATLNERIVVLNSISHLVRNQALHYAVWYEATLPDSQRTREDQTEAFYEYIKVITSENADIIHKLQSVLQSTIARQQQYEYNKYYQGLLQGDQCQILPTVPFTSEVDSFSETACQALSHGIMKRGFVVSIKNFLDLFSSAFLSYQLDISNVVVVFKEMLSDAQIHDINRSIVYLFQVFETLDAYSSWAQGSYNDFIMKVISTLFVSYIIVVIFIFFSGWIQGYRKFKRDFNSTKQLLSLFNMNLILENVYLIQFLKNNDFGIK